MFARAFLAAFFLGVASGVVSSEPNPRTMAVRFLDAKSPQTYEIWCYNFSNRPYLLVFGAGYFEAPACKHIEIRESNLKTQKSIILLDFLDFINRKTKDLQVRSGDCTRKGEPFRINAVNLDSVAFEGGIGTDRQANTRTIYMPVSELINKFGRESKCLYQDANWAWKLPDRYEWSGRAETAPSGAEVYIEDSLACSPTACNIRTGFASKWQVKLVQFKKKGCPNITLQLKFDTPSPIQRSLKGCGQP